LAFLFHPSGSFSAWLAKTMSPLNYCQRYFKLKKNAREKKKIN